MTTDAAYVWQQPGWPGFHHDPVRVVEILSRARRSQGVVEGKLTVLGFEQRLELAAEAWSQEALATAAIEGVRLDLAAVRSSVARRLGVGRQDGPVAPRNVEGLLDIMDDAVTRCGEALTHERLYAWQAALFPTGYSGIVKIRVGGYREHEEPMQIVSGRLGRERVHYEAPPSDQVAQEMERLLAWFNAGVEPDLLVRAALAHLWFETIHPFEDGNGRVGRALVDLVLARDSGEFWFDHRYKALNERQRKVMNLLLDAGPGGFEGGMSTKKYESIAATSRATASRELLQLEAMELLELLEQVGAGRSTRYYVKLAGWVPLEALQ